MRNIIVGTAGHIDHGKTALVKALTGVDADRLPEEKRRGISIDLGFAHLQLTPDIRIGFIDVPGHERFVRNMLAGAAGIDLVLLVVAATESIKPQTREHFEICRMLGVQAGVIAVTKADLVDSDTLELVKLELDDLFAGSFLEGAAKIAVSSRTGVGLPELRAALADVSERVHERETDGFCRLPIDRVFTIRGFGTVVTGTLIAGTLRRGQEVELFPAGRRLRIRGLEVYDAATECARSGQRTAVNLMDIETSEIKRGMVLAEAGRFRAVSAFDCRLDLIPSAKPLKSGAQVHLHIGAATLDARVRLLDRRHARVTLREPALVLPGDRFIMRIPSPVSTIGGGVVADIGGRRGRKAAEVAAFLAGDDRKRLELIVSERPDGISEAELIALTGFCDIPRSAAVEVVAGRWFSAARANQLRQQAVGLPRQPQNEDLSDAKAALELAFAMAGLAAPLIESSEARSILHILLKEGRLTRISPDLVLHRDALDGLLLQLAARQGQRFSVPEFKTWTGVSRKYAIPLLEYLDRRHVTRREGDARVIL